MDGDNTQPGSEWVRAALWASPAVVILIAIFFFFILPKLLPASAVPNAASRLAPQTAKDLDAVKVTPVGSSTATSMPTPTPVQQEQKVKTLDATQVKNSTSTPPASSQSQINSLDSVQVQK